MAISDNDEERRVHEKKKKTSQSPVVPSYDDNDYYKLEWEVPSTESPPLSYIA